jgi:hypothetical protein
LKLIGITNATQQAGINGGLAIWNLIVATTAAQFVERLGRRPLWLIGNAGMLAAFAIVNLVDKNEALTLSRARSRQCPTPRSEVL